MDRRFRYTIVGRIMSKRLICDVASFVKVKIIMMMHVIYSMCEDTTDP
jgi:hypothetical protein